jgi:spore germination protein YaaH
MWLEDAESIQAKLSVMQAEGIAGVAEWKLSFEICRCLGRHRQLYGAVMRRCGSHF